MCQEAELVPIFEPEVLMDGEHTLERCCAVTEEVLHQVFDQFHRQCVMLETARLNAMHVRVRSGSRPPPSHVPWPLTFSFARALQQPALEIWAGDDANRETAQQALLHRARCNAAAVPGEYDAEMEPR